MKLTNVLLQGSLSLILILGFAMQVNAADIIGAASCGNVARVAELLQSGVDVDTCRPTDGWTPLMVAANSGRAEMVQFLLENGANKDLTNCRGKDAWKLASTLRCKQLIKKFQPHVTQVKSARNVTP